MTKMMQDVTKTRNLSNTVTGKIKWRYDRNKSKEKRIWIDRILLKVSGEKYTCESWVKMYEK